MNALLLSRANSSPMCNLDRRSETSITMLSAIVTHGWLEKPNSDTKLSFYVPSILFNAAIFTNLLDLKVEKILEFEFLLPSFLGSTALKRYVQGIITVGIKHNLRHLRIT